jgi:hypothetical protein
MKTTYTNVGILPFFPLSLLAIENLQNHLSFEFLNLYISPFDDISLVLKRADWKFAALEHFLQ